MKMKSIRYSVLLLAMVTIFNNSCKKTIEKLPAITTTTVSSIALTTAICGGTVTNEGGLTVSEKGVCWDTLSGPTISDWKALSDSATTALTFNVQMTGLIPNTTYYARAFAYNAIGISYGNEFSFTTKGSLPSIAFGTVSDIDGNSYKTVTIGTQTWMAENLRVTLFTDGGVIPSVTDSANWSSLSTPAFCTYADTSSAAVINQYGRLYNWYAVNTGKLCPLGWKSPTDSDWTVLSSYLIQTGFGYKNAGNTIAKAMCDSGWVANGEIATAGNNQTTNNESGFAARPAGARISGSFNGLGTDGYWWTNTDTLGSASYYHINNTFSSLGHIKDSPTMGLSVRCVMKPK